MQKTALLVVLGFSSALFAFASGGKILVGYAPDANSHFRSLLPFITKLVEAGYQVTVFHVYSNGSGAVDNGALGANLSAVTVELPSPPKEHAQNMGKLVWSETLHAYQLAIFHYYLGLSFDAIVTLGPEEVTRVLNSEWDFVLVSELFALHTYALAHLLHVRRNVPYALFSTTIFTSSYRAAVGQSWVTRPALFGVEPRDNDDKYQPGHFLSRLLNTMEHASENVGMGIVEKWLLPAQMSKLMGRRDYSQSKFIHESSLYITDSIDYLALPSSTVPEMRNTGSHCEVPKPLSDEYAQFVEDPHSLGTIYVAFGTYVQWDYAPEEAKNAMFSALEQLSDYRIIFAYRGEFPTRQLPAHLKLVKWAPQLDVLTHHRTKVFLTHGGLKSVKEALCTETPMLVLPMFAEQSHNAKMVLSYGIGGALNKYHITAEGIASALRNVLGDRKYAERVKKLHAVFLDRPIGAMDEGEFYVTRLIARQRKEVKEARGVEADLKLGVHHAHAVPKLFFERRAKHMTLWQYLNVDVIVTVAIVFIVTSRK